MQAYQSRAHTPGPSLRCSHTLGHHPSSPVTQGLLKLSKLASRKPAYPASTVLPPESTVKALAHASPSLCLLTHAGASHVAPTWITSFSWELGATNCLSTAIVPSPDLNNNKTYVYKKICPDFKTYRKATVINTVSYCHKDRHINQ